MHYLITGGAGFIGSHVADRLIARDDQITVLDNVSTGNLDNLRELDGRPGFTFAHGSVTDRLLVEELVEGADVVIHLAAAVGVRLIIEHPLKSLITNIRGAENVLDAAAKHGIKTLITSTSEIYGKNPEAPLSESSDRVLGPPSVARWAYSTSKAVDEILSVTYHREQGLPTVIVRLFNTVGPRQTGRYGMVLPRLVDQAIRGEQLTVYGDGNQTRCFCYIDDAVDALLGLLDDPRADGEIFNVGNPEEVSIKELAERVIERSGSSSEITFVPYEEAYEEGFEDMIRRVPDISKIGELLGWQPRRNLDEIIDVMVDSRRAAAEIDG